MPNEGEGAVLETNNLEMGETLTAPGGATGAEPVSVQNSDATEPVENGSEGGADEPQEEQEESLNAGLDLVPDSGEDNGGTFPLDATAKHLQNDDVFEDPEPGKVPEEKEDVQLLAATEAALEDLQYLVRDLLQQRGMSQAYALEAERITPGFLGDTPIGYYSKTLSSTKYKASLESLVDKIWEFIKTAIAKIKALITRLFNWALGRGAGDTALTGKESSNDLKRLIANEKKEEDQKSRTVEKTAQELSGAVSELNNAVRKGVVLKEDGKEIKFSDMDKVLGSLMRSPRLAPYVRKYINSEDPFFLDLVNQGPYYSLVMETNKDMMYAINIILEKGNLLAQTLANAVMTHDDRAAKAIAPRTLELITKPTLLKSEGKEMNLAEFGAHLRAAETKMQETRTSRVVDFDQIYNAIASIVGKGDLGELNRFIETALMMMANVRGNLDEIEDILDKQQVAEAADTVKVDWHRVIHSLNSDLAAFATIVSHVRLYRYASRQLVRQMARFAHLLAEEMEKHLIRDERTDDVVQRIEALKEVSGKADKLDKRLNN